MNYSSFQKMPEQISRYGLTYDDVLLVPQYSEVLPQEVDTTAWLTAQISLKHPLLSAAMDTVTESKMAIAMAKLGGMGVIHKNFSPEDQANEVKIAKQALSEETLCESKYVAAAVGVGELDKDRVERLLENHVDIIVIDTAHGHSKKVVEMTKWVKKRASGVPLIVGNIATSSAATMLAEAGADAVKVGIGPGSICTTRIVAGVGVPQLSAIFEVAQALERSNVKVIADGGVRYSGDIVKALALGADTIMLGNMFAGTDESAGKIINNGNGTFKSYRGMGSIPAMEKGSADRYNQLKEMKLVPEGIEGEVPYRGCVGDIVYQLIGGLRSGMGYCGAKNLSDLRAKAEFVLISPAGKAESHVHDLSSYKESPNYK